MALQLSDDVRNARLDAIEVTAGVSPKLYIYSGAVTANCADVDPTGLLVTMTLPVDWMNAAAAGVKTLKGTWSVAATNAGTALSFRIKDSTGTTTHIQGTVGLGSGDLSLDNTSIGVGQIVTVTTFSLTDGNA